MVTVGLFDSGLGLIEGRASVRGDGDESAVGAAVGVGRAGGAAEGTGRPGTPAGEALAVGMLTALGSGTGRSRMQKSVPGRRCGRAISDEGLSVREAVEWCSTGITVREVTRLRRLARNPQDGQ